MAVLHVPHAAVRSALWGIASVLAVYVGVAWLVLTLG